jgi:opacity protein-like surface antigen
MKVLLAAAAVAAVLVPAAAAAAPAQTLTPWDSTRVIHAGPDACAFPIQVHSTGTIRQWTYDDGTVKTMLQGGFKTVWTNLDTGTSIVSPLAGPAIQYPDGTVVVDGNNGRFIAQGEGPVYSDVGRTVTTLEGVIFSAGQHSETLFPNVCAALD